MAHKKTMAAAAVGLGVGAALYLGLRAEQPSQPTPRPSEAVAAPFNQGLAKLLMRAVTAHDPPVPTEPSSSAISAWRQRQLTSDAAYARQTLAPVVAKHGLRVVPPVNTDHGHFVNIDGQIIFTDKTGKCGVQFDVDDAQGHPGAKQVAVSVFGNLSLLHDGNHYPLDAYNGKLGHAEGQLGSEPKVFNPAHPNLAASYVVSIFAQVCHVQPH